MQQNSYPSRKMGFLEKIAVNFHNDAGGSTATAGMIKVNNVIDPILFKQAWTVLFKRMPMLRVAFDIKDGDYWFNFNAKFEDIPIRCIHTEDSEAIMQEYNNIVEMFDIRQYFWRTTLINMVHNKCSHIIFGSLHTICDGKSISALLGELLRIIEDLENGIVVKTDTNPIPEPLDTVLDQSRFIKASKPFTPVTQLYFDNACLAQDIKTINIIKTIDAENCTKLLSMCKLNQTTLTSALCAALTQSILEEEPSINTLDLSIAFDLRPYTLKPTSNQILAFYAHQLLFNLNLEGNINFWDIARQAKERYQRAIKEYGLESADNHELFNQLNQGIKDSLNNKQFLIPYTISNVGVIDTQFVGLNKYDVDNFTFSVRNRGLFGLIIFVSTLNNKINLNFNFATPALSKDHGERLTNRTMQYLLAQLKHDSKRSS